jgi:hypothetical protein
MAETSEGTSKPSDFFVGVVDFFSILLPGALLTFLTEMLLAEPTSQHPMLGKALKGLRAERRGLGCLRDPIVYFGSFRLHRRLLPPRQGLRQLLLTVVLRHGENAQRCDEGNSRSKTAVRRTRRAYRRKAQRSDEEDWPDHKRWHSGFGRSLRAIAESRRRCRNRPLRGRLQVLA